MLIKYWLEELFVLGMSISLGHRMLISVGPIPVPHNPQHRPGVTAELKARESEVQSHCWFSGSSWPTWTKWDPVSKNKEKKIVYSVETCIILILTNFLSDNFKSNTLKPRSVDSSYFGELGKCIDRVLKCEAVELRCFSLRRQTGTNVGLSGPVKEVQSFNLEETSLSGLTTDLKFKFI